MGVSLSKLITNFQQLNAITYMYKCELKSWRVAVVHEVQAKNCKVFWLTDVRSFVVRALHGSLIPSDCQSVSPSSNLPHYINSPLIGIMTSAGYKHTTLTWYKHCL